MRVRHAVAVVAVVAATVACTPAADPGAVPSSPSSAAGAVPTAAAPAPTPSPAAPSEAATDVASVLGIDWVNDGDEDGIPDAVELAIGSDPTIDGCDAATDCGQRDGPDIGAIADAGANTMLILDASGSMAGDAGAGRTKMAVAKDAITRYVVGLPAYVDAGLTVYGHEGSNADRDKARSCRGIDVLADLGELTHRSVDRTLDRFAPTGWTPIADALTVAGEAFGPDTRRADNRILLVSDGIETCDGDPVATARRLAQRDIALSVDVVGFDVDRDAARALRRVARATGGTYTTARTGAQLRSYFDRQADRIRALEREWGCLARARNTASGCYVDARFAVSAHLREARAEAAERGDDARVDALDAVQRQVRAGMEAARTTVGDRNNARLDELVEQGREARRRLRRRYGRDAAALDAGPCPAAPPTVVQTWGVTHDLRAT